MATTLPTVLEVTKESDVVEATGSEIALTEPGPLQFYNHICSALSLMVEHADPRFASVVEDMLSSVRETYGPAYGAPSEDVLLPTGEMTLEGIERQNRALRGLRALMLAWFLRMRRCAVENGEEITEDTKTVGMYLLEQSAHVHVLRVLSHMEFFSRLEASAPAEFDDAELNDGERMNNFMYVVSSMPSEGRASFWELMRAMETCVLTFTSVGPAAAFEKLWTIIRNSAEHEFDTEDIEIMEILNAMRKKHGEVMKVVKQHPGVLDLILDLCEVYYGHCFKPRTRRALGKGMREMCERSDGLFGIAERLGGLLNVIKPILAMAQQSSN